MSCIVLAKKSRTYMACSGAINGESYIDFPEIVGEFKSWRDVPKMLQYRCYFAMEMPEGRVIKDRGDMSEDNYLSPDIIATF